MIKAQKIWRNGELIEWDDARIHVMAHVLHYGSSVFEGIRCYKTERGSEVFRLPEHIARLYHSARIYRMEIPYSREEFQEAALGTIRANRFQHCYIRPLVFRGIGGIGVNPLSNPVESYIITWEWGKYLGDEALEQGVDVCVSSWNRPAANTLPTMAKSGGNYLSSALVKMEAVKNGFTEGIALDPNGYISEGSGENVFVIRNGKIYTTPIASAILPGITRDSVITLARELGYTVIEEMLPREILYICDELFMTGTAAEITPVRSVDHIVVGDGKRGPVTAHLQRTFFDYVEGRVDDRHNWMTPAYKEASVS